jgi:hypothetical protein
MAMPILNRIDYRTMKVSWKALSSVIARGGSEVKYILYWDKGDSTRKVDKAVTITNTLEHTIEVMEASKDYRFIV